MITFYYICDYVNAAVRAWLVLQLVDGIFEPRLTKKWVYTGKIFIAAFAAFVQFANSYLSHDIFSNGILAIMIFMVAVGSTMLYECKFRYVLCLSVLSWGGLALIDFFVQICAWLILQQFGVRNDIFITLGIGRGFYLIIGALSLIPTGFLFKKWFAERRMEVLRFWKAGAALAFLLLPCMVYFQRIYLHMGSEQLFNCWWTFFMGAALLFFALGFYMLKQKMEEEKRVHQLQIRMLENSYEEMLKGYREKSVLMHDVRNHFRTLQTMLEERSKEECQSYLVRLTGELNKKWNAVWTNHKVLDLVLNMKFQEAEGAKIAVLCQSDDLSGLKLDSVEICALFANLLDNAVEANERCPEEMERKIEVLCKKQGSMLAVSISNPVENGMENPQGMFSETTKTDKISHGFGMFSIERVLHAHSGYLKIDTQENWLKVLIYLDGF